MPLSGQQQCLTCSYACTLAEYACAAACRVASTAPASASCSSGAACSSCTCWSAQSCRHSACSHTVQTVGAAGLSIDCVASGVGRGGRGDGKGWVAWGVGGEAAVPPHQAKAGICTRPRLQACIKSSAVFVLHVGICVCMCVRLCVHLCACECGCMFHVQHTSPSLRQAAP